MSYILQNGYKSLMTRTRPAAIARARLDPGRLPVHGRDPLLRAAPRRPVPPTRSGKLDARARAALLAALIDAPTLEAACRAANISRTQAIAARACDPLFAQAWDQILAAKTIEIDMLLADFARSALNAADGFTSMTHASLIISTARWLSERATAMNAGATTDAAPGPARKSGRKTGGQATSGAAQAGNGPSSIPDAHKADETAAAIAQLIAAGEQRLQEALSVVDSRHSKPERPC